VTYLWHRRAAAHASLQGPARAEGGSDISLLF